VFDTVYGGLGIEVTAVDTADRLHDQVSRTVKGVTSTPKTP
jgi:hypothetical protein